MSGVKKWDGSKWVDNLPKKWNGSKWVDASIKRWGSSGWEEIGRKRHVETWTARWTGSYNGASNTAVTTRVAKWGDTVSHYALWWGATWNQIVSWNGLKSPHRIYEGVRYIVKKGSMPNVRYSSKWMYQGREQGGGRFDNDRGRQRSMIGFNYSSLREYLSGSEIEKVELYLESGHFHSTSGGTVVVGYHNLSATSTPNSFSEKKNNVKSQKYSRRKQGQWIVLPKSVGEAIRDGEAKGITLNAHSDSSSRYGWFLGKGSGSDPKLRITYKK